MKQGVILVVFGLGVLFYFQGCASNTNTPINSTHIQKENLDGAKYIGGKIWQDQRINARTGVMNYDKANQYCTNLTLLETKGWELASIEDYKKLGRQKSNFKFKSSDEYVTADSALCSNDNLLMPFIQNCTQAWTQRNQKVRVSKRQKNAIRCVLDVKIYDKKRKRLLTTSEIYRHKNTYEGYIKAFDLTKDIQDIKKAYSLASNDTEKLNAERIMAKEIPNKVFTVIDGQVGASNVQTKGSNFLNISGASMSGKDFSKNFALKSDFLQYGSYRVKVKFNFDAVYSVQEILGKSDQSMHKEMTVVYNLNSANQYRDVKNITFKGVIVNVQGGAFGVKTYSATMKSNELSYEIIGVE